MEWDQIERNWDEMTRRVQSPSLPRKLALVTPSPDEPELLAANDSSAEPDPINTLVAKPQK